MSKPNPAKSGPPRTWLITGVVAAGAVAYAFLVFIPGQRSIQSLRTQLQDRRDQILQAESLALPLTQASERLTKTREVSAQWRTTAPSHSQLTEQFARLSLAATEAGVSIERFDPEPPVEFALLAQHGVGMQFQGEFAQVFDFVRRVEQLPGTIWIPSFRISGDGQAGKSLRGELTLTIFVDRTDYDE